MTVCLDSFNLFLAMLTVMYTHSMDTTHSILVQLPDRGPACLVIIRVYRCFISLDGRAATLLNSGNRSKVNFNVISDQNIMILMSTL